MVRHALLRAEVLRGAGGRLTQLGPAGAQVCVLRLVRCEFGVRKYGQTRQGGAGICAHCTREHLRSCGILFGAKASAATAAAARTVVRSIFCACM
jgi:hypothetical protein